MQKSVDLPAVENFLNTFSKDQLLGYWSYNTKLDEFTFSKDTLEKLKLPVNTSFTDWIVKNHPENEGEFKNFRELLKQKVYPITCSLFCELDTTPFKLLFSCLGKHRLGDQNYLYGNLIQQHLPENTDTEKNILSFINPNFSGQTPTQKLIESEAKYRALIDTISMGIGLIKGSKVVFANSTLLKMFGYDTLDEMQAHDIFEYVADYDKPRLWERFRKVQAGEKVTPYFQLDYVRKDGVIKTFELSTSGFTINGEAYRQAAFIDVTDRKLSDQKLIESENSLREAQNIAKMGRWSLNLQTGVLSWSEELVKLFKLTYIPKNNEEFFAIVHPEDLHLFESAFQKLSTTHKQISFVFRARSDTKSKQYRYFLNRVFQVIKNEKLVGLKGINLDITEQKETEQELENTISELKSLQAQLIQTEKMASLGQLMAGVAHEINNPINFVINGSKSLSKNIDMITQLLDEYSKLDTIISKEHLQQVQENIHALKTKYKFEKAKHFTKQLLSDIIVGADRTATIIQELKSFSRVGNAAYEVYDLHQGIESYTSRVKKFFQSRKCCL